jgi:transposase InsO family protein
LKLKWVPHDLRDQVVDFVRRWSDKTEIPAVRLVGWAGLARSKFFDWKNRYGKANEHNGWIPRDHWLEDWEEKAIIDFHQKNPLEGYRRLTFMMLDQDVVAVSPSSVYRVLAGAGLLGLRNGSPSKKGTGFVQPLKPHEHWHVDVSYLNICGTFYYLCSVLDGCSRSIVHWEIREQMKEADIETILERAKEKYPQARPRVISDNGPQFIARDFKEFIRLSGMTHVRTSPFYPQSNGKIERWHQSLKRESIRPRCPLSLEDARQIVAGYVEHYNTRRLHSALGYVTPADKMAGREPEIFAARDRKLEAARQQRQAKRQAARAASVPAEEKPSKSGLTDQTAAAKVAPSRETEAGSAEEQPAEG